MSLTLPQISILPLTQVKPYEASIERKMLGCQYLLSRAVVPTVQCQYHTNNWGTIFSLLGTAMVQQPNISTKGQCLTFTYKLTNHLGLGQLAEQNPGANPQYDASRKIMSFWGRNSGPIVCLHDGHQGNTKHKSCRHSSTSEGTGKHMCFCNT